MRNREKHRKPHDAPLLQIGTAAEAGKRGFERVHARVTYRSRLEICGTPVSVSRTRYCHRPVIRINPF